MSGSASPTPYNTLKKGKGASRFPSSALGTRSESQNDLQTLGGSEKKHHKRNASTSSAKHHSRDSSIGQEGDVAEETPSGSDDGQTVVPVSLEPGDDPWWNVVVEDTPHGTLSPASGLEFEDDEEFDAHLEEVDGLGPLEPGGNEDEQVRAQQLLLRETSKDTEEQKGATFIVSVDSTDAEGQVVPGKLILPRDAKGKDLGSEGVKEQRNFIQTIQNFLQTLSTTEEEFVYPIPPGYHIFPDSLLIVMESEPSSIAAFCLSSKEYQRNLEDARRLKARGEGDSEAIILAEAATQAADPATTAPETTSAPAAEVHTEAGDLTSSTAQVKQVQWTEEVDVLPSNTQGAQVPPQGAQDQPQPQPQGPPSTEVGNQATEQEEKAPEETKDTGDFEELVIEDTLNQKEGSHIKYRT